jgi:hypothetical protein
MRGDERINHLDLRREPVASPAAAGLLAEVWSIDSSLLVPRRNGPPEAVGDTARDFERLAVAEGLDLRPDVHPHG